MNKATGDRSTALPRPPYGVVQAATNFLEAYRKFGLARKHLPLTWQRLASSDPYRMNLSATTAARVVQVLRFLALIDEGGNRTPDFEAMDRSHNDATWRSILAAHVAAAYPAVFALLGTDLDRERVVAAFRLYDPPYERRKMASLFIELCELAGITNPQLAASMFAVPISTSEQASGPTDLQPANLALTLSEETAVVEERLPANDPPPAATQATPIPIVADPVFIAATGRSSAVPTALPAAATATVVGAAEASSTWSPLDPADLAAEKLEVAHRAAAAFAEYGLRVEGLDPSEAVVGPTLLRYYFRLAAKQKLPPLRATLPEIGLRVGRGGLMLTLVPEQGGLAFDVPRRDRYLAPFQDGIVHLPPVTSITAPVV